MPSFKRVISVVVKSTKNRPQALVFGTLSGRGSSMCNMYAHVPADPTSIKTRKKSKRYFVLVCFQNAWPKKHKQFSGEPIRKICEDNMHIRSSEAPYSSKRVVCLECKES